MPLRTVTGQVKRPDNTGWPFVSVNFVLKGNSYTGNTKYPADQFSTVTDAGGNFSIDLPVNDNGQPSVWYIVRFPDGTYTYVTIPYGTLAITLDALILASTIPVTPDIEGRLNQLIDARQFIPYSQKGAASGVATLDGIAKIPLASLYESEVVTSLYLVRRGPDGEIRGRALHSEKDGSASIAAAASIHVGSTTRQFNAADDTAVNGHIYFPGPGTTPRHAHILYIPQPADGRGARLKILGQSSSFGDITINVSIEGNFITLGRGIANGEVWIHAKPNAANNNASVVHIGNGNKQAWNDTSGVDGGAMVQMWSNGTFDPGALSFNGATFR